MIAAIIRYPRIPVALTLASVLVAVPAGVRAAGVTIAPASVPADYAEQITLDVSGLTAGQTVLVETFLDYGGDGTIDFGDPIVQCFMLTDGEAAAIGGVRNVNVPGDDDGVTDGRIRTLLRPRAFPEIAKGIAPYLYKVSRVTGSFEPVAAIFEITQSEYPQKVTGTVRRGGLPEPFAYVFLITPEAGGPIVGGVADADGNFSLKSATGTYTLAAVKLPTAERGFVFDVATAPQVTITAGATITQDLTLAEADATISGRLTDLASGAGIPGQQMIADSGSGDPGLVSLTVSDPAGYFTIPVSSAASDWGIEVARYSAALQGYLSLTDEYAVHTGGGDVSGVAIRLSKATALVYGTLQNDQGQPLSGVAMETGDEQHSGAGLTDGTGYYVAGARAGAWRVGASEEDLLTLGYYSESVNVTLSDGEALQQNLTAYPFGGQCVGDCDGNGIVTPDELVTMTSIALGTAGPPECPYGVPGDTVTVDLIVRAANGCPA